MVVDIVKRHGRELGSDSSQDSLVQGYSSKVLHPCASPEPSPARLIGLPMIDDDVGSSRLVFSCCAVGVREAGLSADKENRCQRSTPIVGHRGLPTTWAYWALGSSRRGEEDQISEIKLGHPSTSWRTPSSPLCIYRPASPWQTLFRDMINCEKTMTPKTSHPSDGRQTPCYLSSW